MIETERPEGSASESVEISFPAGLPGFPDAYRFRIEPGAAPDTRFRVMASLDDPEVRFVVVPPRVIDPDYDLELDDQTARRLGIDDLDDAAVFCIVTLRERPEDATVNLLGPIVVNRRTREAAQVALSGSRHSVRSPLRVAR